MPSQTELAWTAGVIDSDGYIGIIRRTDSHTYMVRIYVTASSYPAILHVLHELHGGRIWTEQRSSSALKPGSYSGRWGISTQQAVSLLRAVLPYLKAKRDQAECAIEMQDLLDANVKHLPLTDEQKVYRYELFEKCKALKSSKKWTLSSAER